MYEFIVPSVDTAVNKLGLFDTLTSINTWVSLFVINVGIIHVYQALPPTLFSKICVVKKLSEVWTGAGANHGGAGAN